MFRHAYERANSFTLPIALSHKFFSGFTETKVSTMIVLNKDGWALTAWHAVENIEIAKQAKKFAEGVLREIGQHEQDSKLTNRSKKRKIKELRKSIDDAPEAYSVYWGTDDARLVECFADPVADVALLRLEDLDVSKINHYPVFRTQKAHTLPGTSLCTVGFPFNEITPIWDESNCTVGIPIGCYFARFITQGIFTPFRDYDPHDKYPRSRVETSYPGFDGQSGGPICDVDGVVWAMHTHTIPPSLGFGSGPEGKKVPQFWNVGAGADAETILGMIEARATGVEIQIGPS